MLECILRPQVPQKLKEVQIPLQVGFAQAAKHVQIWFEQGEQACCAILMSLPTHVYLPRMIDELVHVALHRSVAAGGVRVEPTAYLHRDIGGPLHCLHHEISGCLEDDNPLAADPGDDGRPVFIV
jgi:hypothetical protein